MTNVSFNGHGFLIPCLVTLLSPAGERHKTFNAFLVEEHDATMQPCNHATMQPHFDRCGFQNLNFPVFDETENCQFHIFRVFW